MRLFQCGMRNRSDHAGSACRIFVSTALLSSLAVVGISRGQGDFPSSGPLAPTPASIPATTQSTQPATTQPDPKAAATPREAYRALVLAINAGDRDAIVSALTVDAEPQRELVQAIAEYAHAMANLRQTATQAYGRVSAGVMVGGDDALDAAMARIDRSVEQVEGDSATLVDPADATVLATLRQLDGRWKVTLGPIVGEREPAELRRRIAEMDRQIRLFQEIADDIQEHKYQTVEEAAQVLRARMMRPDDDLPTSQPSSTAEAPTTHLATPADE